VYGVPFMSQDMKTDRLAAILVTKQVLQMPVYQKAQSIAIFLSMPGREVSTRDIVLDALDSGKAVFVPYLHSPENAKNRTMDMLQLKNKNDFLSLQPDNWGIPSLSHDSVAQRRNAFGGFGPLNTSSHDTGSAPSLDVVFVPSVAFDASHRRLGHGKGFYDRYLSKYRNIASSRQPSIPMPRLSMSPCASWHLIKLLMIFVVVGIALRQQFLPDGETVPVDEHDWIVNNVIVASS
jgi:5-formyltetrahydrofolate cyclo-ligase